MIRPRRDLLGAGFMTCFTDRQLMFTGSQRQRLVAESEAASIHHHFGVRGRHRKLDPANDRDEVQGQAGVSLRFRLNGAHRLPVAFEEQLDAVLAQG